ARCGGIRSKSDAGLTAKPSPFWIYGEVFVLEIFRDALCLFHLNLFRGGIERVVGFTAFCCLAHVSSRMRERNARFGQADKFDGLLRRDRQRRRFWIGQAAVFACENYNAPRAEAKIFASV